MKRRIFVKLNLVWIFVFLTFFAIILIAINPFQANTFQFILFYIAFFGLILGILNLIGSRFKIPFWIILLISIGIVFLLILQSFKF